MLINAYYRNDFSYSVESGGITNRDAVMVSMKVDTGSPYTIISLETRYPGLSDEKVKEFREKISKTKVKSITPKSASGQEIVCYPIVLDKVSLDGTELEKFPLYLATNIERKLSLIGLDFLNCCELKRERESDVFTMDLGDVKEYRDAFQKRHNDNVLDISILEEAEQDWNEG